MRTSLVFKLPAEYQFTQSRCQYLWDNHTKTSVYAEPLNCGAQPPSRDETSTMFFNPLTTGAAYIRVSIFYWHIKYQLLNMLKIKCDINQQYLKTVDLHFVKYE